MAAKARNMGDTNVLSIDAQSLEERRVRPFERGPGAFLSRERIGWRSTAANVEIVVDLVNEHNEASDPGVLVVEAAPLGAFVAGWSVARIPVGAIAPKSRHRVTQSVSRQALPSSDLARIAMDGGFGPNFPPDGLYMPRTLEWAGNLNVWFDNAADQSVEVHRAFDLRVMAGRRAAVAVYAPVCNSGFRIDLECMGAGWTAELMPAPTRRVGVVVVGVPVAGRRAVINLWVTRLSDERQVLVELAFQSMDGPGEQLGCVNV
jgi:hypothetical protein